MILLCLYFINLLWTLSTVGEVSKTILLRSWVKRELVCTSRSIMLNHLSDKLPITRNDLDHCELRMILVGGPMRSYA